MVSPKPLRNKTKFVSANATFFFWSSDISPFGVVVCRKARKGGYDKCVSLPPLEI